MMRIPFPFAFLVIFIFSCSMALPLSRNVYAQQVQGSDNKTQSAASSSPRYKGYNEPQYKDVTTSSLYVTMRDGTKIAIDVMLP
ncbi:MAG: hypothetical protein M3R15_11950, partial [Acidobacteriota bacterium]|nr:hypothetical protein [Acidobacteriota bacterium]